MQMKSVAYTQLEVERRATAAAARRITGAGTTT
jgi:hypothetical protein